MIWLQAMVTIATIIAISSGFPQLLKLIRLKSSAELSLSTWAMWCLTQMTAVVYAISIGDPVLIMTSSLWNVFYVLMIILIVRYRPPEQRQFALVKLFARETLDSVRRASRPTDMDRGVTKTTNKVY